MRPTKESYFLSMAELASSRGTCCRRKVGAVLVNKRGHVVATGYNGTPAGMDHCTRSNPCAGGSYPSGQGLEKCEALHAEQNALLQCKDVYDIHTAYVTASPCIHCTKLLLNTSCQRIIFKEEYPCEDAKKLWLKSGRDWISINDFKLKELTEDD